MELITSVNNQRVKDVANLKLKKYRTESGLFFAEGLRAVQEAVEYAEVTDLFFTAAEEEKLSEILKTAKEKGVRLYQADAIVMAKLSDTKTPQGVLAVIRIPEQSLQQLRPGAFTKKTAGQSKNAEQAANANIAHNERKSLAQKFELDNNAPVIILDRIQDPGNLGTIIRTADAVGALGIILLEGCVDAYSPKVVRASMGSLFHLPVIQGIFPEEALTWCYRHGYEPAATAMQGAANLYKTDISKKMAFIFGNEANGVSEELQAAAETRLFIPMAGQAESMNVAMAAGIVLFEGLRQRKFIR
ncbi:MAG: RNA methyltransferase [Acidaminococcaceae bacterium]|nr:RNA methyltransferase [Acidaminococcaceae bacterium]